MKRKIHWTSLLLTMLIVGLLFNIYFLNISHNKEGGYIEKEVKCFDKYSNEIKGEVCIEKEIIMKNLHFYLVLICINLEILILPFFAFSEKVKGGNS